MKFEIPFKEDIFRKQLKLNFDLAWKTNLKKNQYSLIYGSFFLMAGALLLYVKQNSGFLFLAIGLFNIVNFYNYFAHYKKRKKAYFNLAEESVIGFLESDQINTWEFNENHFEYKDYQFEIKIIWKAIKGFRIIENNIFIHMDIDKTLNYIIGKEEIGEENFDKIIDFLNIKVKNQVPIHKRNSSAKD